jgi:hypothetical protein
LGGREGGGERERERERDHIWKDIWRKWMEKEGPNTICDATDATPTPTNKLNGKSLTLPREARVLQGHKNNRDYVHFKIHTD